MNLDSIFTHSPDSVSLSLDEEVRSIQEAHAGDEAAKERLLLAYAPALRAAVGRFRDALDRDDLEAAALLAFTEALATHDPERGERLAGRLRQMLQDTIMREAAQREAFTIPKRTLTRFYGILREADGDAHAAMDLAPERAMSREVFGTILDTLRSTESLDQRESGGFDSQEVGSNQTRENYGPGWGERPLWGPDADAVADVEDRVLVEAAFAAVDDDEARICELAYGFTEYEPVPDAEIGHRLALTRPTVQRRRVGALGKMRKAIGVTL